MNTKRVKNNRLVGILGGVVMIGTLLAVIFSSETPPATRVILTGISLLVGGLFSWSFLDRYFRKSLGHEMRASLSSAGDSAGLMELEELGTKPRSSPSQVFRYQIMDSTSIPVLSPQAQTLLDYGYKQYRRYVINLLIGALFLWVTLFTLGFVGELLFQHTVFSFDVNWVLTLVLVAAFFVANPQRYPTSFTILIWLGLNLVFLVPVIGIGLANAVPLFTGEVEWRSVFMFGAAALAFVVYVVLMFGLGAGLRRQAAARKPMRLLILWVFNAATNLVSALNGIGLIWQFLGSIQFLRGGNLTVDMGELVRNKRAGLVVDTFDELRSRLARFKHVPNWSGLYPRQTLLCGDRIWKAALHVFLREADTVAMSLFGFSKSNQGCLYELGLLFDRFPLERVILLVDDTTDLDFLLVTLQENWDNMAADSPNQESAPVRIYRMRNRFDQILPTVGHPLLGAARMFSATQSALAREADCMLRLILEGVGG